MNIIFGGEQAEQLKEKFTLLELDTFTFGADGPEVAAYCVMESIPLDKMPMVEGWKLMHEALIKNYQQQNWSSCNKLIGQLTGAWGEEMDTFYDELKKRINELEQNPVDNWSHVIARPLGQLF